MSVLCAVALLPVSMGSSFRQRCYRPSVSIALPGAYLRCYYGSQASQAQLGDVITAPKAIRAAAVDHNRRSGRAVAVLRTAREMTGWDIWCASRRRLLRVRSVPTGPQGKVP